YASGLDANRTFAPSDDDSARASGLDFEAVARGVVNYRKVGSLADRIEIRERGVPADAVDDIRRTRRHSEVLIKIVQVPDPRDSGLGDCVQCCALERSDLARLRNPNAQTL